MFFQKTSLLTSNLRALTVFPFMKQDSPTKFPPYFAVTLALILSISNVFAGELETPELPGNPEPGEYKLTVRWSPQSEVDRKLIIILPDDYDPAGSYPLLYALHGAHGSAEQLRNLHADLVAGANSDKFILVFPEGGIPIGNSGFLWPIFGPNNDYNDVNYFSHLTQWLVEELAVDSKRIFLSGFSNGAGLTQRLLVERPGVYAGGVAFCFSNARDCIDREAETITREELPLPSSPIPVVLVRGGQDQLTKADGTIGNNDYRHETVEDHFNFWVEGNGNDPDSVETFQLDEGITVQRAGTGNPISAVYMVYVEEMGHRWPNANSPVSLDGNRLVRQFIRSFEDPKLAVITDLELIDDETLRIEFQGAKDEIYGLESSDQLEDWAGTPFRETPSTDTTPSESIVATGELQSIFATIPDQSKYFRMNVPLTSDSLFLRHPIQ